MIPTLNAARELATILSAIERQSLRPDEVIVVDSESDDDTVDIARKYGAKCLNILRREFDHGGTRSFALHSVTTDIVAFTVQDAVPSDADWLANLCAPMQDDSRVAVVVGRQLPRPNATPLERITRSFSYPAVGYRRDRKDFELYGLRAAFCSDANAAYRVGALKDVGDFPAPCIVNEDMAAAARLLNAGFALVYEPRAAMVHSHDYGVREQFQRYFDIGVFFAESDEIRSGGRTSENFFWYLRRHLHAILKQGGIGLLGTWALDAMARATGAIVGRNHRWIPLPIRKHFSRQKSYWAARSRDSSTRS